MVAPVGKAKQWAKQCTTKQKSGYHVLTLNGELSFLNSVLKSILKLTAMEWTPKYSLLVETSVIQITAKTAHHTNGIYK